MGECSPTERTSFVITQDGQQDDVGVTRRMQIENNNGEHTLHLVLVIEDLRVGFYLTFFMNVLIGLILTKAFSNNFEVDIFTDVYGGPNICAYFDYSPSNYVLPILWCFGLLFGCLYSVAAMLRIRIAQLEKKLTGLEAVSLILAYIYVGLSLMVFSLIFAVQPKREKPQTMIIHTFPYININLMFAILQVTVTYFGVKVSWAGLELPRWFWTASVVHAATLCVASLISLLWIANAIGDMGQKDLVGKGLWWSVQSEASKLSGHVIVNVLGMILGCVLPFVQALFISRNGVNSHALVVKVSDNRMTAYVDSINA